MIARLKATALVVLLAGMRAAPNLGADYQAEFDADLPAACRKHGVALYPLLSGRRRRRPRLLLEDGMHPNAAGIDRMVERFVPAWKRLIAADPENS